MATVTKRQAVTGKEAKVWARSGIRGQWCCPLGAVTDDDRIDEEGLRQGVRHCLQMRIGGLAFTSLMEPWSSSLREREHGLEVFLDEVGGRKPVYVNISDHSIKETVRLGQHALDHGASILLVECPYEHAKSEAQVVAFFEYVAKSLDGPIALYNTPHAGMILSPTLIARLCEIENVCAIKNAVDDPTHSALLFRLVGDRIVVSNPTEKYYLLSIIQHGQQVLFSTTASHLMQSPAWQPIEDYAELARSGNVAGAWALYQEIAPLRALWDEIYRVLRVRERAQHPIPYTKYWQELMGIPAGPPRPPLSPLSAEEKAQFRARLWSTGLMPRFGIAPNP